ncbi:MAG: hypothetical protein V1922_06165 [bacterium]
MTEKRIRIFASIIASFLLVTQFNNARLALSKLNLKNLLVIQQRKPSITPEPTTAIQPSISHATPMNFFGATLIPTLVITAPTQMPTQSVIVTPTWVPIISPIPTTRRAPTPKPVAPAIKLSSSKLGVFIINDYSEGARQIVESCPRVIKFIDPQGNDTFIEAAKKYKQACNGVTVARFYPGTEGIKYTTSDNPERSAEDFFSKAIRPNLDGLGANKTLFDYLQMPNEFENTPEWWGEEKMKWNGRFWVKLTGLNKNAGIKTCVGSMPVGNTTGQDMSFIVEELRAMKNMGAALCYHGYTFHYSTDANVELELSLRYRQYYSFFKNQAPDLASMPLILSEGGVAENGDPKGGYQAAGHAEKYKSWLAWFDAELRKDPYVVGVTLFQIGNDSDWSSFNLEPIAPWMAGYVRSAK